MKIKHYTRSFGVVTTRKVKDRDLHGTKKIHDVQRDRGMQAREWMDTD